MFNDFSSDLIASVLTTQRFELVYLSFFHLIKTGFIGSIRRFITQCCIILPYVFHLTAGREMLTRVPSVGIVNSSPARRTVRSLILFISHQL